MKRLIALFLALALCLGLTACGSTGQNETTADAATEAAGTTEAATEAADTTEAVTEAADTTEAVTEAADTTEEPATEGATRTVKDFYDNDVVVPENVTRIVTGKTVVTNLVAIVGGTDVLACLGEGFRYEDGNLCKEVFPGLDGLAEVKDNDMNVESILEMNADVVLISSPSPEGNDVGNLLKEAGIAVAYYNLASSEDLIHAARMIADIIGTDDAKTKAESYIAYYENAMKETTEAAAASTVVPKTAYYRGQRGICGPNSMPGEWLKALNSENVSEGLGITTFHAEITVEEFLNVNPEIVFCESPEAQELLKDAQYAGMTAVENDALPIVPYGLACSGLATAENPIVWYFAANLMHPDTCSFDLEAKVAEFYSTFYGYELSADQIATILKK